MTLTDDFSGGDTIRTVPAPLIARITLSVFFAAWLLDLLASETTAQQLVDPLELAAELLVMVSALVTIWFPRVGALLGIVPMVLNVMGVSSNTMLVMLVTMCGLALVGATRWIVAMTFVDVAYLAALIPGLLAGDEPINAVLMLHFLAGTVGLVVGLIIHYFYEARKRGQREIAALEARNAAIRVEERRSLARELHDLVAHQLSIITLQTMAHSTSEDVAVLQSTLSRIDDASRAALSELRLLVGVLRDDEDSADDGGVDELDKKSSPTELAAQLAQTLAEHGFEADMKIPASADHVSTSVAQTLSRALQEAATNILRYAEPGSRCWFEVIVKRSRLTAEIRSELAQNKAAPTFGMPSGWGLAGIGERVSLIGGTFSAQPVGTEWVVHLSLPLS